MESLDGIRVACITGEGFEEAELVRPVAYLRDNGADVQIIGVRPADRTDGIQGCRHLQLGVKVAADRLVDEVRADEYHALLIPGGRSPDSLRLFPEAVAFVKAFTDAGKPVFAICHGPQLLISARALRNRTLTGWPSIAIDIENAGGGYVDRSVVREGNFVSSRKPDDIPDFNEAMRQALMELHVAHA